MHDPFYYHMIEMEVSGGDEGGGYIVLRMLFVVLCAHRLRQTTLESLLSCERRASDRRTPAAITPNACSSFLRLATPQRQLSTEARHSAPDLVQGRVPPRYLRDKLDTREAVLLDERVFIQS